MRRAARFGARSATPRTPQSTQNVASIALEAGYDSEAAFSRAFKRLVGVPPATWRRRRTGATTMARVAGSDARASTLDEARGT